MDITHAHGRPIAYVGNNKLCVCISGSQLMAVSGAKMLVQTTFAVLVLSVLSTSYQVRQYRVVNSDSGEVLCAASPPNKTLNAVGTRGKCTIECSLCNIECSRGCGRCQAINYRHTTQLCELYYYEPCSYDLQPDCVISKQVVDNIHFPTMIKIVDSPLLWVLHSDELD